MSSTAPSILLTPNKAPPQVKRVEAAPDVATSASIQSISSPTEQGSNASVTVKTNPESTCSITVVYDKDKSTDSGLLPKVADEFGIAVWVWTVEEAVPIGKWPVTITCIHNKRSAVVVGDLFVIKPIR